MPAVSEQLLVFNILWQNEMRSLEVYFPHLPLLEQEVVAVFLAREEGSGVLVVFLVAAVGVRIGELRVACFLCVAVVADRQVGSCPEGGPEVD